MNPEQAVQELQDKHGFKPGRKYELEKVKEAQGRNGGTIWRREKYTPIRTLKLPRDPGFGTGLYDLQDEDDFKRFFEEEYGSLPNGVYTVTYPRGGNKGFTWLFLLRLENGKVVDWWKKSKATNKYEGYSSTYYALPYYFKIREELGV